MRRGEARVAAALALVMLGLLGASRAGAQQVAARFEITEVGDSTFAFYIGTHRWAAARGRGIVVDPARRDALVARFRVLGASGDTVTALVTGQTSRVTTQHFVVMPPPPQPRWFRRGAFWGGTALGLVLGTVLGGVLF